MYKINEIFYSLQGEGANTGTPAVFIRFAGCNLRCPFCDTDFEAYTEMTTEEILDEIEQYPSNFVVLTGGEPSLQLDDDFVQALHERDYVLAIETNGTHRLPADLDWITVSPKEGSRIVVTEADEVKVVYTGQDVEKYADEIEAESYYLQPCSEVVNGERKDNTAQVVAYCLANPHWSLSLQTHKLINIQ
ncbi:MAG: 7-carboxy-7-deazaguanine synthase QueE [Paludibacteraceae bacterium]|nr:7-carboxy-7-deazaguanine synthase QueE [Paludibacteraceae bacterium]